MKEEKKEYFDTKERVYAGRRPGIGRDRLRVWRSRKWCIPLGFSDLSFVEFIQTKKFILLSFTLKRRFL
jgi:hypothetical protein